MRDNYNGGTYSLIQVANLKQRQKDRITLTPDDKIAARRLSRPFPIVCVVSFLENCSSVSFYVGLRNKFIDSVGQSKLGELKPQLVNGSYVQMS